MIGKTDSDLELTFIETDIDCVICLEDVRVALAAIPRVDEIEEEMSSGCLVVRHRGAAADLARLVTGFGRRLAIAPNGELTKGQATVSTPEACPAGHVSPHQPGGERR